MQEQLEAIVQPFVDELTKTKGAEHPVVFEQPQQLAHGDFATSIALKLARILKKNPFEIATELKEAVETQNAPLISTIEAVKPGFLNVFVDWDEVMEADGEDLGFEDEKQEKVLIEHTSINPNKSAHIGHLRNACIGDTLARLLKATGKHVEVHNYIDDLGNQLADTLVGLFHTEAKESEAKRFGDYCWDVYAQLNEQYDQKTVATDKRDEILHKLEEGNNSTSWLGYAVADKIATEHVEELGQFGISYDLLVWERNILNEGFWKMAVERLQETEAFLKKEDGPQAGCWVMRTNDAKANHTEEEHQADKVLVRSNGVLTYTAKDIAYHMWKFGLLDADFSYAYKADGVWTTVAEGVSQPFGRGDQVINVIDYRQEYPQQVVKQALHAAGYEESAERLHHVSYGVVSLSKSTAQMLGLETEEGKNVYAMSGRKGIGIKIKELMAHMEQAVRKQSPDAEEETVKTLALAAIRYNMLRYNTTSDITFDLEEATQVTGNTGIYLEYTFARANSILKKAEEAGIHSTEARFAGAEEVERALLKHLAGWNQTLSKAVQDLEPNLLCTFAYELASAYNRFYAKCPVLKASDEEKKRRLALTELVIDKLGEVLTILGLPLQKKI